MAILIWWLGLLSSRLNNHKNDNIAVITTAKIGTIEHNVLKKIGFLGIPKILKPEPFYFITSILEQFDDSKEFQILDNWFFNFGDYDVF